MLDYKWLIGWTSWQRGPWCKHAWPCTTVGIIITIVKSFPRPGWNLNNAIWSSCLISKFNCTIRLIPVEIEIFFNEIVSSACKNLYFTGFKKTLHSEVEPRVQTFSKRVMIDNNVISCLNNKINFRDPLVRVLKGV